MLEKVILKAKKILQSFEILNWEQLVQEIDSLMSDYCALKSPDDLELDKKQLQEVDELIQSIATEFTIRYAEKGNIVLKGLKESRPNWEKLILEICSLSLGYGLLLQNPTIDIFKEYAAIVPTKFIQPIVLQMQKLVAVAVNEPSINQLALLRRLLEVTKSFLPYLDKTATIKDVLLRLDISCRRAYRIHFSDEKRAKVQSVVSKTKELRKTISAADTNLHKSVIELLSKEARPLLAEFNAGLFNNDQNETKLLSAIQDSVREFLDTYFVVAVQQIKDLNSQKINEVELARFATALQVATEMYSIEHRGSETYQAILMPAEKLHLIVKCSGEDIRNKFIDFCGQIESFLAMKTKWRETHELTGRVKMFGALQEAYQQLVKQEKNSDFLRRYFRQFVSQAVPLMFNPIRELLYQVIKYPGNFSSQDSNISEAAKLIIATFGKLDQIFVLEKPLGLEINGQLLRSMITELENLEQQASEQNKILTNTSVEQQKTGRDVIKVPPTEKLVMHFPMVTPKKALVEIPLEQFGSTPFRIGNGNNVSFFGMSIESDPVARIEANLAVIKEAFRKNDFEELLRRLQDILRLYEAATIKKSSIKDAVDAFLLLFCQHAKQWFAVFDLKTIDFDQWQKDKANFYACEKIFETIKQRQNVNYNEAAHTSLKAFILMANARAVESVFFGVKPNPTSIELTEAIEYLSFIVKTLPDWQCDKKELATTLLQIVSQIQRWIQNAIVDSSVFKNIVEDPFVIQIDTVKTMLSKLKKLLAGNSELQTKIKEAEGALNKFKNVVEQHSHIFYLSNDVGSLLKQISCLQLENAQDDHKSDFAELSKQKKILMSSLFDQTKALLIKYFRLTKKQIVKAEVERALLDTEVLAFFLSKFLQRLVNTLGQPEKIAGSLVDAVNEAVSLLKEIVGGFTSCGKQAITLAISDGNGGKAKKTFTFGAWLKSIEVSVAKKKPIELPQQGSLDIAKEKLGAAKDVAKEKAGRAASYFNSLRGRDNSSQSAPTSAEAVEKSVTDSESELVKTQASTSGGVVEQTASASFDSQVVRTNSSPISQPKTSVPAPTAEKPDAQQQSNNNAADSSFISRFVPGGY